MIIAPNTNDMYAKSDTIPAKNPFSLYLLNQIRPIAINKNNIPAKEMYIFSMDIDISVTSCPIHQKIIITYIPRLK